MKSRLFLFLSAIFYFHVLVAQENFTLEKDEDSIKVYLKTTPNSRIKTFKAITKIDASPEAIIAVITNIQNNHKWIDGISAGEMIDSVSAREFYYRQRIPLPFPYQNREIVQHVVIGVLKGGQTKITITEANEKAEPLEGFVRMQVSHGYWLLKPMPNGTQVDYVFVADPGDNIPSWMVNYFLVESPFRTLKQLNKCVTTK